MKQNRWVKYATGLITGLFLILPLSGIASETYVPPPVQKVSKGDKMWNKSVEYGKKLFNDTNLGRNGKSCSTCHDGSKLRNVSSRFPKYVEMADRVVSLGHMINYCINGALKGTELDFDSTKSIALQSYLRTFR
ncbi:MAG: c-type cytochrome [bacterium]